MGNVDVVIAGRFIRDVRGLKDKFVEQGYLVNSCSSNQNPPLVIVNKDESEHKDLDVIVSSFQDSCQLHAVSDKPLGFGGVAECPGDGVSTHTIQIVLKDFSGNPAAINASLLVMANQIVPISNSKPSMVGGVASTTVGPVAGCGEITLTVVDQAKKHFPATVKVRFI